MAVGSRTRPCWMTQGDITLLILTNIRKISYRLNHIIIIFCMEAAISSVLTEVFDVAISLSYPISLALCQTELTSKAKIIEALSKNMVQVTFVKMLVNRL